MDNHQDMNFMVEVAYATASQQHVITIFVPAGCTVLQAAQLSGINQAFPDIDWSTIRLGIFGRLVSSDHVLAAGDRVEIYRPLLIDPKESRRQRAHTAKQQRTQKAT
jgi:putative ubiquitin-RnfH superfamily antitoxin RatB of RatAB toxin-antitoxin module